MSRNLCRLDCRPTRAASAVWAAAGARPAWVIAFSLAFALLAFGGCTASGDGPEDPVWGKEMCAHCVMLVSEKPPAAQALMTDGTRKYFDDVGCLALWLDAEPRATKKTWVRGHGGEGWVEAEATRYATGQRTPMDYGFLAALEGIGFDEVRRRMKEMFAEPSVEPREARENEARGHHHGH